MRLVDFTMVSVFVERDASPLRSGNPLAVFAEPGDLNGSQMQAVARTLNLSETTFVTAARAESYDVRIFTPGSELPFAGHPTLGTTWVLRRLGAVRGEAIEQRSEAGATPVRVDGDLLWFEREGRSGEDLAGRDPSSEARLERALGLEAGAVGLEARELGRPGRLGPAVADAGIPVLLVPVRDLSVLERSAPRADLLTDIDSEGVYCFTATQAGRVRARGFFPGAGIPEDPATGAAAAALGLYLADRVGPIDLEVRQGTEIGRPCLILLKADSGRARVGGACAAVVSARLEQLP
jgi:trans-2,3-dihydro-3-hydroxyanthranilate isomerase